MKLLSVNIFLCSMILTACGGGDGAGAGGGSSDTTVSLSGVGSKGLFDRADVQAYEVVGGKLVSLGSPTQTASDGSYTLVNLRSTSNPVVVSLKINALTTMLDETSVRSDGKFLVAQNAPPIGTEIRSTLPDMTTNSEVHITPFTEMAVAAAQSSGELSTASLLAGRQMVMDTLGLNPFIIKPVNANAMIFNEQIKMMLLLTSVAQDAKTHACTGDLSGVTCAIKRLTDLANLTKGNDGTFTPQNGVALKTKIDLNVSDLKAEINAWINAGWKPTDYAYNIKNQVISTAVPTAVNPSTLATMASLEGFINSIRTGFNKAASSMNYMAKDTQTRTNDIVLKTLSGTTNNIDAALRNCLSNDGLVCATGSPFTKISDNNYSFSGKSSDNSMDIAGTISGSYDSTGALKLNFYEVYKKANTQTKLYELNSTASGEGVKSDSNNVTLTLTRLDITGYDTTSGSSKWIKLDLSGATLSVSDTNKTFSVGGGLTLSTNEGDSFSGTLNASGKKIKISANSSTYDWAADKAVLSLTAKSANSLLLSFSIDVANDLSNYYPKVPESASNIQKGTLSITTRFTDNTTVVISGSKSNLTDKLISVALTTNGSLVNVSGTLTTQPNGAPDDFNSDGLTVTSSGNYSAVIKKGVTSDLKKGTTKIGEIKSDGIYVDGKKFVLEPFTQDINL